MKISIYGDSFVTSGIFKSALINQIGNDHNFKLKDVNWPDTPFHNDYGEGNFSKIKEYLGNEEDVINFIEDSEILVTDLAPVSESILDNVKNLKYIGVSRGGPVNIDIDACQKKSIIVANAPGRNASAVAEFTVAKILAQTRLITLGHTTLMQGEWRGDLYRLDKTGRELSELTIGLIGYSHIGKLVKNLLVPFGCKIVFSDPYVELNNEDIADGIKKVSLENLLEISNVVSIHARVTKETVNLIGKKEISLMKKDSYLINTARGPLLDYKALHDALSNGKLKGAALDTFYEEPLPENHIFKNLNNVTITPHIAGASVKTAYYAAEVIAKDVRNYIDGKKLVNRIC